MGGTGEKGKRLASIGLSVLVFAALTALTLLIFREFRKSDVLETRNDVERTMNLLLAGLRDHDDFGSAIENSELLNKKVLGVAAYTESGERLYSWGATPESIVPPLPSRGRSYKPGPAYLQGPCGEGFRRDDLPPLPRRPASTRPGAARARPSADDDAAADRVPLHDPAAGRPRIPRNTGARVLEEPTDPVHPLPVDRGGAWRALFSSFAACRRATKSTGAGSRSSGISSCSGLRRAPWPTRSRIPCCPSGSRRGYSRKPLLRVPAASWASSTTRSRDCGPEPPRRRLPPRPCGQAPGRRPRRHRPRSRHEALRAQHPRASSRRRRPWSAWTPSGSARSSKTSSGTRSSPAAPRKACRSRPARKAAPPTSTFSTAGRGSRPRPRPRSSILSSRRKAGARASASRSAGASWRRRAARSASNRAPVEDAGRGSPSGSGDFGMKVLVVDDERNIRESLQRLLELEGIDSASASDGPRPPSSSAPRPSTP